MITIASTPFFEGKEDALDNKQDCNPYDEHSPAWFDYEAGYKRGTQVREENKEQRPKKRFHRRFKIDR